MSIRTLAHELYRAQQKVNLLQTKLEKATPQEQGRINNELHDALAELKQLRKILDSKKEESSKTFRHSDRYGY
jgi:hypothetical protein